MKSADGNSPHWKRFPSWPRVAEVLTVSLSSSFTTTSYGITSERGEGGGREGSREKEGLQLSVCGCTNEREDSVDSPSLERDDSNISSMNVSR